MYAPNTTAVPRRKESGFHFMKYQVSRLSRKMATRKMDSIIGRLDEDGLCTITSNLNASSRRRSSGSVGSPRSRLRRTLTNAARSRSYPGKSSAKRTMAKMYSRHSTSSLGPRNKHTCRLRSAESLRSLRSSRLFSRHDLHHHPSQNVFSGAPNAEFKTTTACHEWCALRSSSVGPRTTGRSTCAGTAVQKALKKEAGETLARINIKYKNECGRTATITSCGAIHHDSGRENKILNVTIKFDEIEKLERSDDIEWVDRKGAIYFVQNV